jgi:hypothetical protein
MEVALEALLTSATVAAAAAKAGVGERTLRGWLKRADFSAEYRARRVQLLDGAVKVLQAAAAKAVGTLVRKLDAPKDADALKAAQLILDQAFRGTELLDLARQVEELKQQVGAILSERKRPRTTG